MSPQRQGPLVVQSGAARTTDASKVEHKAECAEGNYSDDHGAVIDGSVVDRPVRDCVRPRIARPRLLEADRQASREEQISLVL